MKIIFDFDDVLFDTSLFKQKFSSGLSKYNVDSDLIMGLYSESRKLFNPKVVYKEALKISGVNVTDDELQKVLDNLFLDLDKYIDQRLIDLISVLGKDNCFVLTAEDESFQRKKIKASLISNEIDNSHIFFVKENKDEKVKEICELYSNELIVFVDDKDEHIQKAISQKLPNLQAILYDENGFEKLTQKISELSHI